MQINFESALKRLTAYGGILLCLLSSQAYLHGTWVQPPVIVSNPAIWQDFTFSATLKVNPQGNAISVWTDAFSTVYFPENGNDTFAISGSFYTRGVGWGPPQVISSLQPDAFGGALYQAQGDPDVAMNSSNYAVAVWEGFFNADNFPGVVIAATRDGNTGIWSPVTIISDQGGDFLGNNVNVSLNEAGTALAAWQYRKFSSNDFYTAVSFLPFGGSWTTPLIIATYPGLGGDGKPYPVINPSGNAVVTWKGRLDPFTFLISAATFDSGTSTWSAPVTLDTGDFQISQNPRCAMDINGNAVAIWQAGGFARTASFDGTSWGATVTLGTSATGDESDGPDIVMDPKGNATATWTSSDFVVLSASLPLNGTWSTPQVISAPGTLGFTDPFQQQETLAVNPEGDVIAIWGVMDANFNNTSIASAYKPFGQNWRAPETVFNTGDFDPSTLNIGLASCGFAVALWQTVRLPSDRPVHPSPYHNFVMSTVNENLILPQNALGFLLCCEKFATHTTCLDILTVSPDSCVLFFNIFRNGVLIATLANTGGPLQFVTPHGCNKNNPVYTISTVNIWGFEGEQVPFVFN